MDVNDEPHEVNKIILTLTVTQTMLWCDIVLALDKQHKKYSKILLTLTFSLSIISLSSSIPYE